ncbi:hypothetical protein EJ06DRAFT_388877 [Trichodelitschia bisporula]|uniref:Uncharacterized protein n=1 Tax=Trichodelitschia bisporula TaxID=703511 RepID=A0A6G1HZW2_9PEZI|nr:hypothetical protein EJ06DRAFT_388877 [Trichodelitschia bisporula]
MHIHATTNLDHFDAFRHSEANGQMRPRMADKMDTDSKFTASNGPKGYILDVASIDYRLSRITLENSPNSCVKSTHEQCLATRQHTFEGLDCPSLPRSQRGPPPPRPRSRRRLSLPFPPKLSPGHDPPSIYIPAGLIASGQGHVEREYVLMERTLPASSVKRKRDYDLAPPEAPETKKCRPHRSTSPEAAPPVLSKVSNKSRKTPSLIKSGDSMSDHVDLERKPWTLREAEEFLQKLKANPKYF